MSQCDNTNSYHHTISLKLFIIKLWSLPSTKIYYNKPASTAQLGHTD